MLAVLLTFWVPQALAADPYVFQSSTYDASPGGGLAVSDSFASGYTFRVTQRTTISEVGAELGKYSSGTVSVYAALYRVGTAESAPDVENDSELLATALLDVSQGQAQDIHAPMSATLAPGWYAIVLGTGKFSATAGKYDVTLGRTSGSKPATAYGPYVAHLSDNSSTLQSIKVRIYLRGTPATPLPLNPNAFVMRTAQPYAAASHSIPKIDTTHWYAARFQNNEAVQVDQATGWFWGNGSDSLFAAILQLASSSSPLPKPGTNAFADAVVATTLVPLGDRTEAYSGTFSNLLLAPGSYALVVGSGAFGASGSGNALGLDDTDTLTHSRRSDDGGPWLPFDYNLQWVLTGSVIGISAAPDTIDFSDVIVGQSASRQVTVSNTGSSDLHVGSIALAGTDAAQFALGVDVSNCSGKTLVTQANCSFTVTYQPGATGAHAAQVGIASDSAPNPFTVALSGAGVSGWTVTSSASGGGSISPTAAQSVSDGAQPVFALTADPNHHIASVGGSCGGTLNGTTFTTDPVHADCTVEAQFAVDTHSVGGTVTGLVGSGLVLSLNNGAQTFAVATDGSFAFPTPLAYGSSYAVSIATQPGAPSQQCSVINGSGSIGALDVQNVVINCGAANSYTVGGTVSGLTGGGLVLALNGGNPLPVSGNGNFVFATALPDNASYLVTIQSQPQGQVCSLSQASGSIAGADVSNVGVSCADKAPHLQISVTDNSDYARYGSMRDYLVVANNSGSAKALVNVSASFDAAFDVANVHWLCMNQTCDGFGDGGFSALAMVPAHGSITWLVSAPILGSTTASQATITINVSDDVPKPQAAAQPKPTANLPPPVSDTDTLVIFRDGVDVPYADGTQALPSPGPVLSGSASLALAPTAATAGIHTLRRVHGAERMVNVQQLDHDGRRWVRLLGHRSGHAQRASRWCAVTTDAPLLLGSTAGPSGQRLVLLEGGACSLRLPL